MTLSYLPHLGGLQIGFVRHPCRSPNGSGQYHFGHISVNWASINDGILSLLVSMPILCTNHGIHCCSLGKLTLLGGGDVTFAPKTWAMRCQNVHLTPSKMGPAANLSLYTAHCTPLQMLCFLHYFERCGPNAGLWPPSRPLSFALSRPWPLLLQNYLLGTPFSVVLTFRYTPIECSWLTPAGAHGLLTASR